MCCQNLLEMTSFFYISIQFPLTNLASKHFNCNKLKSIFWLCFSEVSHASLPISLPTGKTGSYPRHPMVPQPSNPNYHQILSLLLPKYVSDQSVSVYLATSQYLLQPPSYLCSTQWAFKMQIRSFSLPWGHFPCLLPSPHHPQPFLDGLLFLSALLTCFSFPRTLEALAESAICYQADFSSYFLPFCTSFWSLLECTSENPDLSPHLFLNLNQLL